MVRMLCLHRCVNVLCVSFCYFFTQHVSLACESVIVQCDTRGTCHVWEKIMRIGDRVLRYLDIFDGDNFFLSYNRSMQTLQIISLKKLLYCMHTV